MICERINTVLILEKRKGVGKGVTRTTRITFVHLIEPHWEAVQVHIYDVVGVLCCGF